MGNWQLDPYHTQVEFSAKHLGMMTVRGQFTEVEASADIDAEKPELSSVEVTISTASIRTHNPARDDDLRSSNFLEVDKYPTIKFVSTGVEPAGLDRYELRGDLTIKSQYAPRRPGGDEVRRVQRPGHDGPPHRVQCSHPDQPERLWAEL